MPEYSKQAMAAAGKIVSELADDEPVIDVNHFAAIIDEEHAELRDASKVILDDIDKYNAHDGWYLLSNEKTDALRKALQGGE